MYNDVLSNLLIFLVRMPSTTNLSSANLKMTNKSLQIQVEMLDLTRQHFQMSLRSSGQDLYTALMDRLGVLETDYFDLEYVNRDGNTCWLDHLKPLCKQHNAEKEFIFTFCVKFYAPHPNLLEDEFTRYLFALQIKRDLYRGQIQCSENTAALLAAFIVQAEIGDYLEDAFLDHSYLAGLRLVPSATPEFLDKVMECHRSLIGQTPTEADLSLLDTARKVEMYGIRLKPVKGSDGMPLNLAVSHAGLFVFQGVSKVNTFSWARIRKLSFKRKKFLIKLHPEGYDAVEFFFESRNECKGFWKQCIEHHAFFRCQSVKVVGKSGKASKNAAQVASASSTGRVNRSPGRGCGGVSNTSQPILTSAVSIGSDANHLHHHHHVIQQQQQQATSTAQQPSQVTARSLPLAGTVDDAAVPSFVQLPTGGSLRYPQRVMLVVPRRADGTIGRTTVTTTQAVAATGGGGFLVMLPTTSADQQQQNAWLSAIQHQHQQQQRAFSPVNGKEPTYSTLQTSLVMTTQAPRNGSLQDGGNVCPQTLSHLPTARVLSPNFLTTSQTGLSTACTVIPSAQRPASGRVVYVDSATGRLISDTQLVAVPRPLNVVGSGFSSAPASQAPTVATSPIGGPYSGSTAAAVAATMIGGPTGVVPQDISNTAPIPGGSSTASSLPQLLRSRPHGPPPPAPERRDSVHPRDRQLSSSTLDSGITSKSASLSRPPFDASAGGVEEDEELPPPPPPPPMEMQDPDPAHPYPFNVIPVEGDFSTRRPMQASCLSLAARSVRSSCQSLLPTDNEDLDEDEEEENRSLSHHQFASRSASLHRPMAKRDRYAEASTTTQDDIATALAVNRSSTNSSATGSVAAATSSASSRSLVSLSSKSRHEDRSLRSSRQGSTSCSSRNLPRAPASVAYHLLRELTMTERTYKKDLDVVCEGFREAFTEELKDSTAVESVFSKIFTLLYPIRAQAIDFLNELESRFTAWSVRLDGTSRGSHRHSSTASAGASASGSASSASASATSAGVDADSPTTPVRIGDLFVTNLKMLQLYRSYLRETECLIIDLERLVRSRASFQSKMQSFEAQKSCYLPFYAFLLKPMHRLLQYRSVLERLMRHYNESNPDMQDCRVAHARLLDTIQSQWDSYKRCENLYKSLEVERDLVGVQTTSETTTATSSGSGREKATGWLASRSRQFIREGLLQKLSKKGYQQRMFFLFSDQLIYASRTNAPFLQFKVHGQFPLQDLMVEEAESPLSFTVYSGNRCFVVAAPSEWQRDRWLEDISRAILAAKTTLPSVSALTSNASAFLGLEASISTAVGTADNTEDEEPKSERSEVTNVASSNQGAGKVLHRATTSVHVCWHRSSTFSMSDILRANEYQTSGYLLRKFKNSNGWQKLWVVFTQLCLFFHKSYQDTFPLASLPLLGYSIITPSPEDNIRKEFVFKLQFKNHVYFFRDDSQTSFERWFDCLSSAAGTNARQRLVSSRHPVTSTVATAMTTTTTATTTTSNVSGENKAN